MKEKQKLWNINFDKITAKNEAKNDKQKLIQKAINTIRTLLFT